MMNQSFTKQYADDVDRSHPSGSDHVFHGVGNGITQDTSKVPSWVSEDDASPPCMVDLPAYSGQVPPEPIQVDEKGGSMVVTSIVQQPAVGVRVSHLSYCYETI